MKRPAKKMPDPAMKRLRLTRQPPPIEIPPGEGQEAVETPRYSTPPSPGRTPRRAARTPAARTPAARTPARRPTGLTTGETLVLTDDEGEDTPVLEVHLPLGFRHAMASGRAIKIKFL